MIFFFKSCLPASPQAHSLHSHESLHISRWKVTLATWYLRCCFWVEWSILGLNLHCLQVGVTYFKRFSVLYLQSTEQVAAFCRSLHEMNPSECVSSSPSPDSPFPPAATPRQLSDADKLRKVICELVETERTYVKVSIAHLTQEWQMVVVTVHVFLLSIDLCFCPPQIALALNNTYILHDQSIFISVSQEIRGGHSCALAWILSNLSLPGINVARWITGLERVYKGIMSRLSKMLFFITGGTYSIYVCLL